MSKQYQVKQVETNKRGYKVTRTVSTEDAEEIKALLGLENESNSDSKKETSSAKGSSSKKSTKSSSKKGIVIDAEFTEVGSKKKDKAKPKALSSSKNNKLKSSKKEQGMVKPKALPAPKIEKPKTTKSTKSKESAKQKGKKKASGASSKKPGVCIFNDSTGRFSVYKKPMGYDLYDKEDCVSQLVFVYDDLVAMKTFREKIKEILDEERKKRR